MSNKNSYSGILADPLPKWTTLTRPSDEEIRTLLDAKMKALLVHYDIDPEDAYKLDYKMASVWANLSWRLAREHVPGFSEPKQTQGRPATRKTSDITLVMHVELLKKRDKLSERTAIEQIVSQNIVSGTVASLRRRYYRAKEKFRPNVSHVDNIADREDHGLFVRQALEAQARAAGVQPERQPSS
jgi:hypothetical protein